MIPFVEEVYMTKSDSLNNKFTDDFDGKRK